MKGGVFTTGQRQRPGAFDPKFYKGQTLVEENINRNRVIGAEVHLIDIRQLEEDFDWFRVQNRETEAERARQ